MKVICIKDNWTPSPDCVDKRRPKYGEVNIVIEEKKDRYGVWYTLQGYESEGLYRSDGFIPLSDIDETEIASIREQDKIYH